MCNNGIHRLIVRLFYILCRDEVGLIGQLTTNLQKIFPTLRYGSLNKAVHLVNTVKSCFLFKTRIRTKRY